MSDQAISGLQADDFEGLVRLETLDLSHNSLTTLPAGVFDDLYLLRTLHLNNNQLTTVLSNTFEQLFLLEDLTLSDNPDLALPDGMFGDFSRFDGMQSNGELTADTGAYPHIDRFLTKHSITSPEEFIAALPALYKERFTVVFRSKAAAQDLCPVITRGSFPLAQMDGSSSPGTPTETHRPIFRETVEFLRKNDEDWSAGIIDFSEDSPSITEPASCTVCHGSLNKPLWGKWYRWLGTESPFYSVEEGESASTSMQQMLESSDSRIDPLDFSASIFFHAEYIRRFLKSPNHEAYVFAAGEAGSLWSWRHAEVLFHRLKTRYPDFRRYAEGLTCSSSTEALIRTITREFDQREHNLFIPANIDENMIDENGFFQGDGITVRGDALTRHSYHYQNDGSIAEAVSFLALVELWRQEPIVRQLYRKTSHEVTVPIRIRNTNEFMTDGYLHYDLGEATAEDELIQKIRLHFGYGSRATPVARASQNEVFREGVVASAAFWDGHNQEMRSRVCDALRDGRPGNLQTSQDGSKVVATWDTPGYDAASVTGYQILRSVNGSTPEVHVADTSTTDTTWTDENPPEGDLVYEVKAIYDGYYLGPASIRPNIGATGAPSIVGTAQAGSTLVADTSGVGDADGLTEVSYSYQWLADDADIVEATVASYTLTHSERD